MRTRYFKVIRDITSDYAKNIMLIVAIALGVFGVGTILGGYSVVSRAMKENYGSTIPASATIELEENISESLLDSIRLFPGIAEAERHATITARMKVDTKWYPLLLFVVDDFKDKRTNKIHHVSGKSNPSSHEMLAERTALVVMDKKEGDSLLIKTPQGSPRAVRIQGVVHDPGLAPAWQEQTGYGYISMETLQGLGERPAFNQLRIVVSDDQLSRDHIRERAEAIATTLKQQHFHVHEIQIPPPGKHPHQSQMTAVMTIFIIFTFLILILASILVATVMATVLAKQVRQIGVMKTIGAKSFQITALYSIMLLTLCVAALTVAIPLSQLAATAFYKQIAVLLNLEVANGVIPYWVLLVQIASGILIPFVAAAFPIVRGSRVTIRRALDHSGASEKSMAQYAWASRFSFLGEALSLSLRNIFRQPARLALTLGLLAAGGAMFMTALNVSNAWDKNLNRIYEQRLYDLEFKLNEPIIAEDALEHFRTMPSVRSAEGWIQMSTSFYKANKTDVSNTYPDKGHGSFSIRGVAVPTALLHLSLKEGRWLNDGSAHEVVLNQLARLSAVDIGIGDSVTLSVEGTPSRWKVVGFSEDVGAQATAYVPRNVLEKISGVGKINAIYVAFRDRSKANVVNQSRLMETYLEERSVPLNTAIPVWLVHNAIAGHMKVLVNSLMTMAILMALVGLLGLTSAMSMNVLERTREIGVMRAIGATPRTIRKLIVGEGMIIGVASVFIAVLISVFLSAWLGKFIGGMAFKTPLSLSISITALISWVTLMTVGSYLAMRYPAASANKITTREALSYE